MSFHGAPVVAASVVAVDVGKNKAVLSVTSADRHRLFGPAEFAITAPALTAVLQRVCTVLPAAPVKVGMEAAGHYHRPLLRPAIWPADWQVVELSPARVAEQRRVQGRRRIKTDAIDLEAITELVLAGHGGCGDGPNDSGDRAQRVGDAACPPGPGPDRGEESAAGAAGPQFCGVNDGGA